MVMLSDEVLLEVFGYLDIDNFFTVRLLNRHIYSLTTNHLSSIVNDVAKSTFPTQDRILIRKHGERAEIAWLNALRYRQLAAIMLECFGPASLAANDPFGDKFRDKISEGWKVFMSLASIAKAHYKALSSGTLYVASNSLNYIGIEKMGDDDKIRARCEISILREFTALLRHFSIEELQGVLYIREVLLDGDTFRYPEKDSLYPSDRQFDLRYWTVWNLLKKGPQVFWRMWWLKRSAVDKYKPQYITSDLLRNEDAWKSRALKGVESGIFSSLCASFMGAQKAIMARMGPSVEGITTNAPVLANHPMLPHFSTVANESLFRSLRSRLQRFMQERERRAEDWAAEYPTVTDGVAFAQTLRWAEFNIDPPSKPDRLYGCGWGPGYGKSDVLSSLLVKELFQRAVDYEAEEAARI